MRKIFLFLLTINITILCGSAFAQSDFTEGYLITKQNDTIYTLIDNNSNCFRECKTLKPGTDSIIIYKPFDITGFRLSNGRYFVSKEITLQNSYIIVRQREYDVSQRKGIIIQSKRLEEGTHTNKVFLEFLLYGELNLYYYQDNIDHYFIENSKQGIMEISNEEVITYNNGVIYSESLNENYKNLLKVYMNNNPEIISEINKTEFDHKDLIDLTRDYHNIVCKDYDCIVFERTIPKVTYNFTLFAGANYSRLTILHSGEKYPYLDKISPLFGVSIIIKNIMPQKERFWIQCELYYQELKYKKTKSLSNTYFHDREIFFETKSINPAIKAIFTTTTSNYKPYFTFGLSGIFLFDDKIVTALPIYSEYNNPIINLCAGAGMEIPIFEKHQLLFDLCYHLSFNSSKLNVSMGFEF